MQDMNTQGLKPDLHRFRFRTLFIMPGPKAVAVYTPSVLAETLEEALKIKNTRIEKRTKSVRQKFGSPVTPVQIGIEID